PPQNLQEARLQAVIAALKFHGTTTVLDLGCGSGMLLERLVTEPQIKSALGVDMSTTVLGAARRRLSLLPNDLIQNRIRLLQALATNPDPRFLGFSAVTAIEVIEHMDAARLTAFGQVIFGYIRPALVILTTPNFEYNVRWNDVPTLRHKDHRFEWTRSQFLMGLALCSPTSIRVRVSRDWHRTRRDGRADADGYMCALIRSRCESVTMPQYAPLHRSSHLATTAGV